jgi:hypothetical protein
MNKHNQNNIKHLAPRDPPYRKMAATKKAIIIIWADLPFHPAIRSHSSISMPILKANKLFPLPKVYTAAGKVK